MKVVNVTQSDFEQLYSKLVSKLNKSSKTVLIIGIASGGIPLQDGLFNSVNKLPNKISVAPILCQRPSTQTKKSNGLASFLFKLTLKVLPYFVLDRLRVLEHNKLLKRTDKQVKRTVEWVVKPTEKYFDTIIIIDDAVDSGYSFSLVNEFVKKELNFNQIITAAVVCTQNSPIFTPEVYLYKNVLVRFPWSLDAKK